MWDCGLRALALASSQLLPCTPHYVRVTDEWMLHVCRSRDEFRRIEQGIWIPTMNAVAQGLHRYWCPNTTANRCFTLCFFHSSTYQIRKIIRTLKLSFSSIFVRWLKYSIWNIFFTWFWKIESSILHYLKIMEKVYRPL